MDPTPKELAAISRRSAEIVRTVGWTQGAYAMTAEGKRTMADDPDATCFCAMGAADRATQELHKDRSFCPMELIEDFTKMTGSTMVIFNDGEGRVAEDVGLAFDRMAERYERMVA